MRRSICARYLAAMPQGRRPVRTDWVSPAEAQALFRDTEARASASEKSKRGFFNVPDCDYSLHSGVPPLMSATQAALIRQVHQKHICDTLNDLSLGTVYETQLLPVVIRSTAYDAMNSGLHSAASEHFNHAFFWRSVKPWGAPCGSKFREAVDAHFSAVGESLGLAPLIAAMKETAMSSPVSGWTWLLWTEEKLCVRFTPEGTTPVARDEVPLATLPTLHHFRHIDYGLSAKGKEAFVDNCLKAMDFGCAERIYARAITSQ